MCFPSHNCFIKYQNFSKNFHFDQFFLKNCRILIKFVNFWENWSALYNLFLWRGKLQNLQRQFSLNFKHKKNNIKSEIYKKFNIPKKCLNFWAFKKIRVPIKKYREKCFSFLFFIFFSIPHILTKSYQNERYFANTYLTICVFMFLSY